MEGFFYIGLMKEYIVKRERTFHLLALMTVIASVFVQDLVIKIALLILGLVGLMAVSAAKEKKTTTIIYAILLVITIVGYFLISNGMFRLPQN